MKLHRHQQGSSICLVFTFGPVLGKVAVEAMAHEVEQAMEQFEDLRLLLDLSATNEVEAGAFLSLEGAITSTRSIGPVSRYAVVAAPHAAASAIEGFGKFLPLEARTFEASRIAAAQAWCCDFA
ncbi:MAG: STAS/SEC14 domain-containing protein [Erythrobacter sp.]|jgi:hypothetical protein|nr:STAS/SEC14 domain-containing protein [Erythrobacter sp.]